MEATLVQWLSDFGSRVFFWSLGIFLVINGAAAIAWLVRGDRAMVNRWTSRILAVDLLLIGTGVGVPLVTTMARMTVTVIATSFGGSGLAANSADAVELEGPGK